VRRKIEKTATCADAKCHSHPFPQSHHATVECQILPQFKAVKPPPVRRFGQISARMGGGGEDIGKKFALLV